MPVTTEAASDVLFTIAPSEDNGLTLFLPEGFLAVAGTDVSEHVTKHDAIQLIDLPEGTSLFNVDPDQITEDLKQNPWVSGVMMSVCGN